MNEKLTAFKSALAAGLMAMGTLLGWKGILLMAWVGVMALDYLSGSLAACREGQWSSAVAPQGLWHKGRNLPLAKGVCLLYILSQHQKLPCEPYLVHVRKVAVWQNLLL